MISGSPETKEFALFQMIQKAGKAGMPSGASGYELQMMAARGWPIVERNGSWVAFDPRAPLELPAIRERLVPGLKGCHFVYRDGVDSTNRLGRELAAGGAPAGTVLVAETQTAGRGRLERSWHSPRSAGLWFSVLIEPPSLAGAPPYALLAAVAVCRAVRRVPGVAAELKWPNDVLIAGKKVCGILLEAAPGGRILVAGIGMNVGQSPEEFPDEIRGTATSLAMACQRPVDRNAVLAEVLGEIRAWVDRVAAEGFGRMMAEYRCLTSTIGRQVRVELAGKTLWGKVSGVDDDGALRLETSEGTRRLLAGDVTHLRPVGAARK